MRTPEEWLALPKDELATELGRVFTPEPWKHDLGGYTANYCFKCGQYKCDPDSSCPVLDPIKLDWNTAMEWFRFKADRNRVEQSITAIWEACVEINVIGYQWWLKYYAQPKHYLIAAAMAVEGVRK